MNIIEKIRKERELIAQSFSNMKENGNALKRI